MSRVIKDSSFLILLLLLTVGAFLHFYNLNWGAPFYFHPDERNIASAVSQLSFPTQLNPHFFAYGSLPIYSIYFTGLILNLITLCKGVLPCPVSFEQAIVISRVYSALLLLLLIPLLFVLGKKIHSSEAGILAASLAVVSVGFIQFAHFGTFEGWLTCFTVLLFLSLLFLLKKQTTTSLILVSVFFGILVAIKVSSLSLLPLPLTIILLPLFHMKKRSKQFVKKMLLAFGTCIIFFCIAGFMYFVTNPYVVLDFPSFSNSMQYESSVGLGTLPVFYTGEFVMTIPVVYQLLHVFPFLINPVLTLLLIPMLIYMIYKTIQEKNYSYQLLLATFFLVFLPQAFLFVKWSRYMVPTLPFIYLLFAIAITDVSKQAKYKSAQFIMGSVLFCCCCLFALAYLITAFVQKDSRLVARDWAMQHVLPNAAILSEVYDLGIVPFNPTYAHIDLFNFYDLDQTPTMETQLQSVLQQYQYIILPSQRLLQSRLNHKKKFPNGYQFYASLTKGTLGFKKMYQTTCDIFCKITYLGNPIFSYEQTASVFERPVVIIYQKI